MTKRKRLPVIEKGTSEFNAWMRYWRDQGYSTAFREKQPSITVPTEYPPINERWADVAKRLFVEMDYFPKFDASFEPDRSVRKDAA